MKKFIQRCALAVGLTCIALFYFNIMYEHKDGDSLNEVSQYKFIKPGILISNTGSSHGLYDFDWSLLEDAGYPCFNFALTSQSFAYDLAILQMYEENLAEGGVMFLPISYFSFNQETVTEEDTQAAKLRYYRILSPKYNPDYDWFTDLIAIRLPILSAAEDFFQIFEAPVTMPSLSQNRENVVYEIKPPRITLPSLSGNSVSDSRSSLSANQVSDSSVSEAAADQIRSSLTPDPEGLEALRAVLASNAPTDPAPPAEEVYDAETIAAMKDKAYQRYHRHFDNKDEYFEEEKIQDLRELIDFCIRKRITPVLITTPFTRYYNEQVSPEFLQQFYSVIAEICQEKNAVYYDYSHDARFTDNLQYFADGDHLNEEGAAYFTQILLQENPVLRNFLETILP